MVSKIFDSVTNEIAKGMSGLNEGLPHGHKSLVPYWPNIQQKTYYLLGASTGVGKTTFTDEAFIYNPYDYIMANETPFDMDLTYFSFEIDKVSKIVKGVCRYLYLHHNIAVDVNYVLSRGKNRCSQEIFDLVMSTRAYFDSLEDKLQIFDMPLNPTGIYKYMYNKALENGKIHTKPIQTKDDNGNTITIEVFDRYEPKNPNKFIMYIVDHVALSTEEKGAQNTKAIIDKISQYSILLRNNFNQIPIIIQQLSYEINDPMRAKLNRLSPMLSDFGDSKYTTRDANYVFSLYSPITHNQEAFSGYNTKILGDRFRSFEILKGRDGGLGVRKGLFYHGKVGHFRELPKSTEMTPEIYEKILETCPSQ